MAATLAAPIGEPAWRADVDDPFQPETDGCAAQWHLCQRIQKRDAHGQLIHHKLSIPKPVKSFFTVFSPS